MANKDLPQGITLEILRCINFDEIQEVVSFLEKPHNDAMHMIQSNSFLISCLWPLLNRYKQDTTVFDSDSEHVKAMKETLAAGL